MPGTVMNRIKPYLGPALALGLLAAAAWVLKTQLAEYNLQEILENLLCEKDRDVLLAFGLTAVNFIVLAGYDILALNYIGHPLPPYRPVLASFAGNAFSNTIGLSTLAGSTVRYRLYSSWGLSAGEIAKIVVFTTLTLWLGLFAVLLLGLPLLVQGSDAAARPALALVDAFYRAGALVFGGGHVVLPLLQAEVVPTGWVSEDAFLAGYGAAQAVPGPLFTFAAFVGAARADVPSGWAGGLMALLAIFAPAFLLAAGALPFWDRLKAAPRARAATAAVNAAVVGVLLAALIDPVGRHGLRSATDAMLAGLALLALMRWKIAPWAVVLGCAAGGAALAALRQL